MTVSTPFSAPACPPDTGASTNPIPRFAASAWEFAGHVSRGCGVVDEDASLFHAVEGTIRPNRDAAQVIIIADASEDELGTPLLRPLVLLRMCRHSWPPRPLLFLQSGYKRWSTCWPCASNGQPSGTHDAQTNPSHLCHRQLPVLHGAVGEVLHFPAIFQCLL